MAAKLFLRYFLRGCLVVAPLAITIFIIYSILKTVDELLPLGIPGLGLIVTIALITLIGFLTSNVIGKAVIDRTERWLGRLTLVKLIYTSIKDVIGAFVGDRKSFDRPVAVRMQPNDNMRALGFITRDGLGALGLPEHVAVYFPQSYNFAGFLALVPREHVELLDANSSDVMTFIVSGGISGFGVGQSMAPPPSLSQ